MPGSAMQRGNMKMGMGDPLTPGFPAIGKQPHLKINKNKASVY